MNLEKFYDACACRECGDIITTEYELDESLCFACSQRLDEEEANESEECPYCGCSLNINNPESCFCSFDNE